VQPVNKQHFGQFLGNVSLVRIEFAGNCLYEPVIFEWLPVIDIGLGDDKIEHLPLVIDNQMQFEPIKIPHCRFAHRGNALEYLVAFHPFIVANPYWGGIYEGNARALPETACPQHDGHW